MAQKALAQIILVIVAIVLVFTYVKPTFSKIREKQDELAEYVDAVNKASEFNNLLNELLAIENSFSPDDMAALDDFLPSQTDDAQIMRDLENIVAETGVNLNSINGGEITLVDTGVSFEGDVTSYSRKLDYREFNVSVVGSYVDLKNFLSQLEVNSYLFEIQAMSFSSPGAKDNNNTPVVSSNSDEYQSDLTLRVYSLPVNTATR